MKLLYGKEYRLWQVVKAEYARVAAELAGAERMVQTYAGTIRQLMEDVKYYRERADRIADDLLLSHGHAPVRPELPETEEDPFAEDDVAVERLRKTLAEDPQAAWESVAAE